MVVQVYLHTTLQRQTPEGVIRHLQVKLPSLSTLVDLLNVLEIHPDLKNTLLVINGRTAEPSQVLEDADEVHLIPAISGG